LTEAVTVIEKVERSVKEEQGKVLPLEKAIRQFVRPEMKLHLAAGLGGPGAAICEIVRQYKDSTPNFELIQSTVTGHGLHLIHCGLVKKMVFAACMEMSDSARPSRIFQKAFREKTLAIENWSLCSLQQRLMAGAFGVPFMPTNSILGSDLARDNSSSFREMNDPFNTEEKVGLVEALSPDISIVHGCVADAQGNTILGAPCGDDFWGALASRGGVLVTVEKIVPTDVIRKYSSLVRIPGYSVKAVSVAPLGVHPFSFFAPGITGLGPYEMDTQFLIDLSRATKENRLDVWIEEWVVDCSTHEGYLAKLGSARIRRLKSGTSAPAPAQTRNAPAASDREGYSPEEMMLVAIAREVVRSVKGSRHKIMLVGAGSRAVGPWLAYWQLQAEGYEIDVMTGNGQIGYTPLPGEAFIQTTAGIRTSKMLTDTIMTHGVIVGGGNSQCLSVLGAAQIDQYGNINSTKLSEDQFLVGSGGANDSVNAREVIVAMDQSSGRFLETLPYVTSPGNRVSSVVSDLGVFRKAEGTQKLYLAACFPDPLLDHEKKIARIRDRCGWPLEVPDTVEEMAPPRRKELRLLRQLMSPTNRRPV
jgi:acyl CoA:acetate/3-ketoacid CoA transferase alpha subunit/acyl CoA:acetate/3-ketoacid CoA transferase beta subunit